jgi:hypothetical protein
MWPVYSQLALTEATSFSDQKKIVNGEGIQTELCVVIIFVSILNGYLNHFVSSLIRCGGFRN